MNYKDTALKNKKKGIFLSESAFWAQLQTAALFTTHPMPIPADGDAWS